MLVSAVLKFGKIDAIGHLMIVVTLITVGADEMRSPRAAWVLAPAFFCGALAPTPAGLLRAPRRHLRHANLVRLSAALREP